MAANVKCKLLFFDHIHNKDRRIRISRLELFTLPAKRGVILYLSGT